MRLAHSPAPGQESVSVRRSERRCHPSPTVEGGPFVSRPKKMSFLLTAFSRFSFSQIAPNAVLLGGREIADIYRLYSQGRQWQGATSSWGVVA